MKTTPLGALIAAYLLLGCAGADLQPVSPTRECYDRDSCEESCRAGNRSACYKTTCFTSFDKKNTYGFLSKVTAGTAAVGGVVTGSIDPTATEEMNGQIKTIKSDGARITQIIVGIVAGVAGAFAVGFSFLSDSHSTSFDNWKCSTVIAPPSTPPPASTAPIGGE
jgi:hypothetical protein